MSDHLTSNHLTLRRRRAASAWRDAGLGDDLVLVGAGEPIGIPGGADQQFPFHTHAEYYWLTESECAGAVLTYDPAEGWTDFVPRVTDGERVWEGRTQAPGEPLENLPAWLAARRGRRWVMLGCPPAGAPFDAERAAPLRDALSHARRPKDQHELDRMRRAIAATAAGFRVAADMIRPGATERAIQIEMEAEFARRGGEGTAYGTIVGVGTNAAVLHFSPGARAVRAGDLVLIDAGAEVQRYAADVTRTFVAGPPSAEQRALYELVLSVEQNGIRRCVAGAEWRDVHLAAAGEIAQGLVDFGLLRGGADSLVEQDAHALFFPHGLGHMVGLGVRDASGFLPGRTRSTRPGLANLRMDLPLEPGYVVTVEPGIYFIAALLDNPDNRAKHRDTVNWELADRLRDFGGIRIEDNVLVTAEGPEVLTAAIPKTL
ncbi:MAG: aminopeptidase P family protein [Phycisphaerae bacterium]|nr:aminopeptidase P family protein [Phycisphaerae bacterium]MCZ2398498.1 aminopeptidase P family protein [Phycisphaerae bacterium]